MKTLKEKIAVMQAVDEGKQIQCLNYKDRWVDIYTPVWNWEENDYRVKPEPKAPKLRAYTFEEAKTIIGEIVVNVLNGITGMVTMVINSDNGVIVVGNLEYNLDYFEKYFTYLDGSPCGIEEGGEE